MNKETTVETPRKKDEADLAPIRPSQTAAPARDAAPVAAAQQQFIDVEPTRKHGKTMGEHVFNLTTYGGFALGANEYLSTYITHSAEKGRLNRFYKPVTDFFMKQNVVKDPYVKGAPGESRSRVAYLLFAVIGGMFTVFPIKWLEDNKSKCVRYFDNLWYGKDKAQNDQTIVKAHDEMDKAPRQSWGSLWKGRALTVASAVTLDYVAGWEHGVTARLLKDSSLKNYRSMDHSADTLAGKITQWFKIETPRNKELVKTGLFMLTLSTALTVLFYSSSKMFARWREKDDANSAKQPKEGMPPAQPAAILPTTEDPREPRRHVSHVAAAERLQPESGQHQAMAGLQ